MCLKNLVIFIGSFNRNVIHETICNFCVNLGEHMTNYYPCIEKINFLSSLWCIWQIMKGMGIKWKKSIGNRKIFMERRNVQTCTYSIIALYSTDYCT